MDEIVYFVIDLSIIPVNRKQIYRHMIRDCLGKGKKQNTFYPYFVDKGGGAQWANTMGYPRISKCVPN